MYTLLIEKPGYLPQKLGPVDVTKKDLNVGDIPLQEGVTSLYWGLMCVRLGSTVGVTLSVGGEWIQLSLRFVCLGVLVRLCDE